MMMNGIIYSIIQGMITMKMMLLLIVSSFGLIEDKYIKQWRVRLVLMQNQFEFMLHNNILLLYVTRGQLIFYRLSARTYGGKHNGAMQGWHEHTAKEVQSLRVSLPKNLLWHNSC